MSDHQIQLSEIPKVTAALATLSGVIAQAHQGQTQFTSAMIAAFNASLVQARTNYNEIQGLKARFNLKTPQN